MFVSLLWRAEIYHHTDDEVRNEIWGYIRTIYLQNPRYYHGLFSIKEIIDLAVPNLAVHYWLNRLINMIDLSRKTLWKISTRNGTQQKLLNSKKQNLFLEAFLVSLLYSFFFSYVQGLLKQFCAQKENQYLKASFQ